MSRPPVTRAARTLVLAALAAAALGGCGSGPAPRLYVLEPVADPTRTSPPVSGSIGALGTAVVTLPGYARDPRIASRDAGIGVSLDADDRWAEAPDEAITRVLAERLRHHAGAIVLVEPLPRGFAPAARVEVAFDRLLREPSGGVEASGHVSLLAGDGRAVLDVIPFRLARGARSAAPEAFFVAVAAVIDDIARLAIDALAATPPSGGTAPG